MGGEKCTHMNIFVAVEMSDNCLIRQNISQNLSAGLSYYFSLSDYIDRPDINKDKTNTYGVNYQYSFTRNLNMGVDMQYAIRANSHNQAREYEEFSTNLTLSWSLL